MRNKVLHRGRTVVAISGKHAVSLAMQWPQAELAGLLGFAISRTGTDHKLHWLPTVLRFPGDAIKTGQLYPSNQAPIQSMVWCDFGIENDKTHEGLAGGSRFIYEVTPVRGQPGALVLESDASVRVEIATEPEHEHGPLEPEVNFNRALSDMQELERLFGAGVKPESNPQAMSWLARGLDKAIVDFIGEVKADPNLRLDVAAYHLQSDQVLDALVALGSRLRISLDWGTEEITTPKNHGPNGPAYTKLVQAGATVHQRLHVSISHNKYMVQKRADGSPLAVLTGSTNFTDGGISTQSNQSVIVRNPDVAAAYLVDFERVLKDDNTGLHTANQKGTTVGSTYEVYFSPHATKDRPDLDRMTTLAKGAKSSRLFMTFRMTDAALVGAMLDNSVPAFGVIDRAYQGKTNPDGGDGDALLFAEAHTADPRVVACNAPLDDEPSETALYKELKRDGYNPLVHHKILIIDWDKPNCVVVTGSANYSANSTAHNDENSLVIHGDQRLAEEYFVEMCRLFTHWHPRWLREREKHGVVQPEHIPADSTWTDRWQSGTRMAQFLQLALTSDIGTDAAASAAAATTPVTATPAPSPAKPLTPSPAGERIKHVVVLMLENRSFDQVVGQLPGVDGVKLDANGVDLAHVNYKNPQQPKPAESVPVQAAKFFSIPEGDIPPPKMANGKIADMYGGPSHSFPSANQQIFNDAWGAGGSGATNTTPPSSSGFVASYAQELKGCYTDWAKQDPKFKAPAEPPADHLAVVMASFSPEQLPVINGLARQFCVCDKWFSEVPGPTEPNRLFMHAATSLGFVHNPWEYPMNARTIYDDIDEHGTLTWATYYYDLSDAVNFVGLKGQVDKIRHFDQFAKDLANPATFPNYVFLCPRYADSEDGFANSQHAPYDVRYGDHWIADVYEALRASPIWNDTLLVITYDEHGGFYDHVTPPAENILPPDPNASPTPYDKQKYGYMFNDKGQPKLQYVFNFNRLGCRVPAVLVSPWLAAGHVENRRLQHTSVLATVRKMWGLRPQPLTAREGQAASFDDLFLTLSQPRQDCPTKLERPALPATSLSAALDQPLSPVQLEVFAQVNHLDGHEDSGKPAPIPATQRQASRYIAERNKAHADYHHARRAAAGKTTPSHASTGGAKK